MLTAQFINTVMAVAAAAIVLFIIYYIIKGIIKLAAIVLLLLLLYAGYLSYTGEKLPWNGGETLKHLWERVELVREKSSEIIKTIPRIAPEPRGR
ncbi:MAG TPA: hypothetical protein VLM75_06125 [Spirochaetota bacterium]|nr:hypothetical protein [Spirochaetota bacterium]